MLQVKPKRRPSTNELLNLKEIKEKIEELYFDEFKTDTRNGFRNSLLNTIRVPKEFQDLTRKLPKPNYSYDNASFLPKYLNLDMSSNESISGHNSSQVPKSHKKNNHKVKILKNSSMIRRERTLSKESIPKESRLSIRHSINNILYHR